MGWLEYMRCCWRIGTRARGECANYTKVPFKIFIFYFKQTKRILHIYEIPSHLIADCTLVSGEYSLIKSWTIKKEANEPIANAKRMNCENSKKLIKNGWEWEWYWKRKCEEWKIFFPPSSKLTTPWWFITSRKNNLKIENEYYRELCVGKCEI